MGAPAPRDDASAVAPEVVLIAGRGRLGRSLAAALANAGIDVANRSLRDVATDSRALATATLVVLAVPDGAIESAARELADALGPGPAPPAVAHASGAASLAVLEPCARSGCAVGSLHPLAPFPAERPPSAFAGIAIGVAASTPSVRARLRALAAAIGAVALDVPDDRRALYHAAGHHVTALLVALVAQAQQLLGELGWDEREARAALEPALAATLANLRADGIPEALSGPYRRGDAETVAAHLSALAQLGCAEPLLAAYRGLAATAVELGRATGLEDARADALARLLREAAG